MSNANTTRGLRRTAACAILMLTAALAAASLAPEPASADRCDTRRFDPVGGWDCEDAATGAPFLITLANDGTLRSTFPITTSSASHGRWERTGGQGLRAIGRSLQFANGAIAATQTSRATATLTTADTMTANITATVEALDGTPLGQQSVVLECVRIQFDW